MNYICKVFTPEFKAKFEAILAQEIDETINVKLADGRIQNKDRIPYLRRFEEIQARSSFNTMWNNPEVYNETPIVKEYYSKLGIWEPEFTEITLPAKEQGYQSQPRVEWQGEIKKIEDINDIFSYKCR